MSLEKTVEAAGEPHAGPPRGAGAKGPGFASLIVSWAGRNRVYLVAAAVCGSLSGLMTMVPYLGVFNIMMAAYAGTCTANVLASNALMVAVGVVVQYAAFVGSSLLAHKGAYRTLFDVRCRILEHMSHVPLGALGGRSVGRLKTVLVDDVEKLEVFLAHSIPEAFMYLTGPVAAFAFLCWVNIPLALVTLIPAALAFALIGYCFSQMGSLMARASASLARLNTVMVEYVAGMRVIKALDMGPFSFRRFSEAVDEQHAMWCDISRKTGPAYAAYLVVIECGMVLLVPLGGWLFATGAIPGSTYLLFAFVGSLYLTEIRLLQELGSKLAEVKSAAARAQGLLDTPVFGEGGPFPARHDIELDRVCFAYERGREVLHDVSLHICEGERLAVVGPSGAGKTTVVELVGRFYDACSGSVRIGGMDVRSIDYDALLENVAVVFQKTFLTSGTIFENICMGKDASLEQVREAARRARIDDFVMGLPLGYRTPLGTLGSRVSGGQQQRIAIARAILKDAPILVLDEATSAADPENQLEIDEAIAELTRGKTVIIVAHRLGVVRTCDRVAVIEGGRVSAVGTHDALMESCPYYASAWEAYDKARDISYGLGGAAGGGSREEGIR